MLFTSHSSSTKSSDTDTEIEDRGTFDVLSGGVWEGISILGQELNFAASFVLQLWRLYRECMFEL